MMQGGVRAEKQRIRKETKIISGTLTPEYRHEASREIARRVMALPLWQQACTVMAYWSLPEEPDTRELMEAALAAGKRLLLPRCLDRNTMTALPVQNLEEVEPGLMGIPAPKMPERTDGIPAADLILVPCVAASPGGIRLGHGAGYYDRFLAGQSGKTVCLCFRALLRPDLPAEDTDIPVDLVVTDGD